jgi:hypothetical protein
MMKMVAAIEKQNIDQSDPAAERQKCSTRRNLSPIFASYRSLPNVT